MIRIIIHGANGTMGKVLYQVAAMQEEFEVVAGIDKFLPKEAFAFPVYDQWAQCKQNADVIIDFSLPIALPAVLEAAKERGCALVVATTGLREADLALIGDAAQCIPILQSANMSLGVNLQIELIKKTAALLGESFDIEIVEKHHNKKVDAPSGTAMALVHALTGTAPLHKEAIFTRHDRRQPRSKQEIGVSAVRGGTVVGTHEVGFYGEDEIIQITHTALSKKIFAVGALRCAKFIVGLQPKLYTFSELVADTNSVTNIVVDRKQSIVSVQGLCPLTSSIAQVFTAVADAQINVDMISQSAPVDAKVSVSFTLPSEQLPSALTALEALEGLLISHIDGVAKLSIEGVGMEYKYGIAARAFGVLCAQSVHPLLVTTSETKILLCVAEQNVQKAKTAILEAFEIGTGTAEN